MHARPNTRNENQRLRDDKWRHQEKKMFPFKYLRTSAFVLTAAFMVAYLGESRAEVPASTLQRISDTGVIRIGYSFDTLPFSFVVGGGAPMGYSIDLCNRIVSHLRQSLRLPELKVEYVQRTASNRVALLKDGTIDLECAASTNNAERRKSVSFSYSHFAASTLFVSLRANKLQNVADLSGHTVASLKGSTNIGQLSTVNRQRNLRMAILPSESHRAAFDMVTEGRVFRLCHGWNPVDHDDCECRAARSLQLICRGAGSKRALWPHASSQ
jgi:glutamate/aspartate transport system substrate-binding protein